MKKVCRLQLILGYLQLPVGLFTAFFVSSQLMVGWLFTADFRFFTTDCRFFAAFVPYKQNYVKSKKLFLSVTNSVLHDKKEKCTCILEGKVYYLVSLQILTVNKVRNKKLKHKLTDSKIVMPVLQQFKRFFMQGIFIMRFE